MLRCDLRAAICAGASLAMLVGSGAALAQTAPPQTAPSQVTPQTLRPEAAPGEGPIVLPGPAPVTPAAGDGDLTVVLGDVRFEGAFPELFAASEAVIGRASCRERV